jgi:hypothetical protein
MDAIIVKMLKGAFLESEVVKIVNFIERGFSMEGEIDIASVFLYAKEYGKSVEDTLLWCEKEWNRN